MQKLFTFSLLQISGTECCWRGCSRKQGKSRISVRRSFGLSIRRPIWIPLRRSFRIPIRRLFGRHIATRVRRSPGISFREAHPVLPAPQHTILQPPVRIPLLEVSTHPRSPLEQTDWRLIHNSCILIYQKQRYYLIG